MFNSFFEQYINQVDIIKKANSKAISNIYEDINTIKIMCEAKQSKIFLTPNCILLFTLKHNIFYECWYFAEGITALETAFNLFLKDYAEILPIRFMVVGKDEHNEHICTTLDKIGCTLNAKLARQLFNIKESVVKILQDEYTTESIEFAKAEDTQEIFDMLKEEFDLIADNLPELSKVKENINKQQIIIIRKNNEIALLHYFTMKNNIMYGYYDIVRKEYRDDQLYFILMIFLYNYIKEKNIKRAYGWRNILIKRFSKIPIIAINDKATIYINFYVYKAKNCIGNF